MTNEEAINQLQDAKDGYKEYLSNEALDMAIKALEQEPSSDDVVSRNVVKEQMIMYGFHAPDMTVTEFVEDLPPVNPKESTTKNNLAINCISRKAVTLNNPCKDCSEKTTWCNEFACKEAREYLDTKNDLEVDTISRTQVQTEIEMNACRYTIAKERGGMGQVEWSDQLIKVSDAVDIIRNLPPVRTCKGHWVKIQPYSL